MSDRSLRISVIFGALDKLTGPLKSIGERAQIAKESLKGAKDELKAITKTQKDLEKFKTTKNVEELTRLSAKLQAAGINMDDLAESERRLTLNADRANLAIREQEQKLEKLAAASQRAARFKDTGGKLMGGGASMMGAGAVITAPMVLATQQAMTMEAAMADVKKVMDFTPEGIRRLNNDLLDMSTRIPLSAEGLTQIAAAAGRAGVAQEALRAGRYDEARKELLAFTEEAAKMGVAFDVSAEEAGSTMAKWRTAFGLNQTGIIQLGDQINALTNSYGGNAAAVTDMVTRIGPLGKVAGVSADNMAAMAQLLNSIGIESEIGATGIKNMMLALTKGQAATKTQVKTFAALGLNAEAVSKGMQLDSRGTILDVLQRIAKLPKAAQAGTLTELFGSESIAAIAPLLTSLDQLQTNFNMVGDRSRYAGSMTQEYLNRIATTEGATGLAMNSLKALNIELGTGLLPTVVAVSNKVRGMANLWRGWAKDHPALSSALMTFVAIGGGLITLLGALGVAAGAASFAFGALGITTWAALWPILAVIAAIALIGAGVFLAIKHFDALKEAFFRWTPLGIIISKWQPIMDFFRNLDWKTIGLNIVQGIINGILGGIPNLVLTFGKLAMSGLNAFKEKLNIKSPSRVMMQMGGYVTEGLAKGIDTTGMNPLKRMTTLAASIAGAVAVGTSAGASPALTSNSAPMAMSATPSVGTVEIHIHAAPGQSVEDIGAEVERRFNNLMDKQKARDRSAFRDSDD
ncbi:phage tail tape measure protein [Asticcacaulis endophyticus]|uniref:Phage tail tape measure protein domain-containing protein n=1 Tax=Asticcacaulis endophyticus TaxID=1395890 RepID=A0A918USX3_9CAUL|nr:phage tail tape measure protein [Asticcacaulis endophyticus]GGZ31972.1 hypothetical protein GCM10011273_17490 [Asticcacaulis endophyticus]